MYTASLVGIVWVLLEMVVTVGKDDDLSNFRLAHCSDNSIAVKHLADLPGSRRHEFYFGSRAIFSSAADERLRKLRSLDADGTREGRDYTQRDTGEDDVVEPCEALAGKLSSELFTK